MCLNNVLLEGRVESTRRTKRRFWMTIDSDGLKVKCFAVGDIARRASEKITEGTYVRVLGKITVGRGICLNHIEYRNKKDMEVME